VNVLEFAEMLASDSRKASAEWAFSPAPPAGEPLGTPEITMPVVRLEAAIAKLREAWSILHDCKNLITILYMFMDTDPKEMVSSETKLRIAGRFRAITERMYQFQLVNPRQALGHSWTASAPELADEINSRPLTLHEVFARPWSPELAKHGGLRAQRPEMTRERAIKIARENFIKHNHLGTNVDDVAVWGASEWVIEAILEASR
jgi:hypothetical protein